MIDLIECEGVRVDTDTPRPRTMGGRPSPPSSLDFISFIGFVCVTLQYVFFIGDDVVGPMDACTPRDDEDDSK